MNTSVIEAIERQKTTNLYDASKSIPDDEIRELVRLATFSPTAFHLQNWHSIAVRSPTITQPDDPLRFPSAP
jgi:nitroreductase